MNDGFPELAPIDRSPIYRQVRERIEQFVIRGDLQPGDRLPPERTMAEQLGVSRHSLRQALAALEAMHLVEIRHGSGVYLRASPGTGVAERFAGVLVVQNQNLPDTMEARRGLERYIAGLAAQRRTEEDIAAARAALDLMESEIDAGELGEHGDEAFHRALCDATKNAVLVELMDQLRDGIQRLRQESLSQPSRPRRSLSAHWRILDAVIAGDPEKATKMMDAHLDEVARAALVSNLEVGAVDTTS